jgi:hypothetical protein
MKSIRTAFEFAIEKAAIEDLRLHDFRHTCITRWAANGVLQQAIMAAAGHHSIPQNLAYTNLQPTDVKNAFKLATPVQQGSSLENASAASYLFYLRPDGGIGRHKGLKIRKTDS